VTGGEALAVSKYSAHPREATELVRFLTGRDVQLQMWQASSLLPSREEFYRNPEHLHARPDLEQIRDLFTRDAIARPSTASGKRYPDVSRAYFTAVHSILVGEVGAAEGMARLEGDLREITGLPSRSTNQARMPRP